MKSQCFATKSKQDEASESKCSRKQSDSTSNNDNNELVSMNQNAEAVPAFGAETEAYLKTKSFIVSFETTQTKTTKKIKRKWAKDAESVSRSRGSELSSDEEEV